MAAEGPGSKSAKANLSTSDFALEHYVVVTTYGKSSGLEHLFAADFKRSGYFGACGQ